MGIDIRGIEAEAQKIGASVTSLSHGDLNDPANVSKLQEAIGKYQEYWSTISAIYADIKTTCMSMIQKM